MVFDWSRHVDDKKCVQSEWKPEVQGFRPKHAAQHLEKQCLSPRQQQEMPAYLADESMEKMCSSGKELTTQS